MNPFDFDLIRSPVALRSISNFTPGCKYIHPLDLLHLFYRPATIALSPFCLLDFFPSIGYRGVSHRLSAKALGYLSLFGHISSSSKAEQ